MAKKPCKYQLPGSDTWMSELEFKKALVDGLLDQLVMDSGVSIPSLKGFSPEPERAETFKLRKARFGKMSDGTELKPSEGIEEGPSEKERFSQKLSSTELDALRTSVRNKFPDSYTAEMLDEVSNSMKTGESNLPFELDNLSDGVTLNDVLGLLDQDEVFESTEDAKNFLRDRAVSGDLLNAKREATEEGVKARSYEKLAEGIRKLKIDTKGIAMSSVPGFNEAWNLSIEAAAKAVEVAGATADAIGKGIAAAEKAFKESDFYKNLKDRDEKLRYMNDLRNGIQQTLEEKKPTGKQKKEGKEFKGKVEEATGVKPEKKMVTMSEAEALKTRIKAEVGAAKDSAKALSEIKQEVINFAKDTLPKESYSPKEIQRVLNAVKKAKDQKSLDKAIDSITGLVEKKNEQIRKKKISDIKKKVKDKRTLYTKVNGKWKGKVTVDAQNEFNEFIGTLSDLDNMSMEELTEVEDIINGIVDNGKADFNRLKAIQEDRKMRDAADMLQELAGDPDATLSDNDAVEQFFDSPTGAYVIIDGKMYTKSTYSKSPYSNKVNPKPINGPVKGYRKVNLSEKKTILEDKKGILGKSKDWLRKASVLDNIYGQLQKIGKDASKTTEFINKNIVEPIQDYFIDSELSIKERMESYKKGLNQIFGSEKVAEKRLNEDASINPLQQSRKEGVGVSNSRLVSLYNMSRLENGMDKLEQAGVDSQDLVDYIESNQDLLDYANFLVDQYNEMKAIYEPTYISVTGMPFPEGYYYPAYTDVNFDNDTFEESAIIDAEGNFTALNAMANNLKTKTNNKTAFNTALGAEEIFIDYVKNMERARLLIPVARSANQLFSQQNRPYLIDKISPEELNDLQKSLMIIFTGKRPNNKSNAERVLNGFMNFNVIATLGLKLKSIPTQMTSFTNFWGQGIEDGINPFKVISAFPKNQTEREFLTEIAYSEYLRERRTGKSLDLELKRILNTTNEGAFKRGWAKFTSKAMWLPGMADYLTNISPFGGGGSYAIAQLRNELSKGNSLEDAKKVAFRNYVKAVEETQQTSREDYTSSFQRSGVGRIFTTYKTSQVGFARKIVKGYRTLGDKNATDAQKAQAYYDMVYYSIASSVLFTLVSGAGYRVLRGDDDDEEFNAKLRAAYDIGMEQVQSVAQGFGFAGFIVDAIMSSAREDEWKLNIPTADFLYGLGKTGGAVIEAMSKDNYSDAKLQTERDRFIEEMGLPKESYSDEDFQQILDLYENASIWRKMDPQQRKLLLKSVGVKNIVKQAEDFYEFSQGNKSFVDAFMGYEKDYFEYAKAKNKTDFIFKNIFGEDYIPKARPENESPEYVGEEVEEDIDSGIPMEEIEEN